MWSVIIMTECSVIQHRRRKVNQMAPKIVDKKQRKKELAQTALDLFAKKGFEHTTIKDIALAAGIGKGTVYEYFDTKDDLIIQAINDWMEKLESEVMGAFSNDDDFESLIRKMVRGTMEAFIADPNTIKILIGIFQLFITDSEKTRHSNIVRDSLGKFRKIIVALLLEGVSKGILRPEIASNAEKIAINLMAFLDGLELHYYMTENYFDLMEQVDFHMVNLLKSLKK